MSNKTEKKVCPYKKECGGCNYQGMPYKEQLAKKQYAMKWLLGKFGEVLPIKGAVNPYNYRNKVHGVFERDKKKDVYTGIYAQGTHRVVKVEDCQIEDTRATAIMKDLSKLVTSFKLSVYDEDARRGLIRHALIRTGYYSKDIMLVLVITSPVFPSKNNFIAALRKLHPEISTMVFNINDSRTSMVLGKKNITAYGKGYIVDELCGMRFKISPNSFYQINPEQTEILYNIAMEYAVLTGKERVVDAYCGIGTIGLIASKKAREVIGVELNKDAVRDAIENAKNNKQTNIRFYNDDAGKFMIKMANSGEKADVLFMDPPRSGSTKEFIEAVKHLSPKKVIYISCGPDTLARDLEDFAKQGFKVKKIQPVDLFPFTEHTEVVVLLQKNNI